MVGNEGFVEATINSLKYPISDIKKMLIGGLFYLVSCILLAIPAYGYATRAISELVEGSNKMPEYNGWVRMFIDGVKVWILMLIYILIMMVITFIPAGMMGAGFVFLNDNNSTMGMVFVAVGGLLLIIAMIIDIVMFIMVFLAWAILAVSGSLLKALNPVRPLKMIIKKPLGTLSLLTQMLVTTIIMSIVSCLVITAPWATFITVMSLAYQLANFYKSANA